MTAPLDSCAIIIFLLSLRTTGINLTDRVIIMEISETLTPNFLRGLRKNSDTYGISLADIELIIINDIIQNIDILENIINEFLIELSVMLMNPILNIEFPLEQQKLEMHETNANMKMVLIFLNLILFLCKINKIIRKTSKNILEQIEKAKVFIKVKIIEIIVLTFGFILNKIFSLFMLLIIIYS